MKLSIQKEILLEKLVSASHFTSSRLSSLALLQGVYVKKQGKDIHLYSTNLNSYYHTVLKSDDQGDLELVVEPKKIIEFISLLQPGKIEIEVKGKEIIITQQRTRGEFPLMDAKDFPLPPVVKEKPQKIKADFLLKNLPLILFSASTDDARPVLTGVDISVRENDLLMVTTDGFRLSLLKLKKEIDLPSAIIPSGFLAELISFLKNKDEISLQYSPREKIMYFSVDENDLYTRIIEGEYPPFEKVIPIEKKTTIETDREELLKNIKLISIFARDISNIVIFNITKEGIQIQPKTEVGEKDVTFQDARVEGEAQRIAFNYKFIIEFLNHLESKKLIIELLRSDAPAVFKSGNNQNFIHIIMPVRIQE